MTADVELRRGPGHDEMSGLLGAYQLGALQEEERRAFEAHALECDVCFDELERGSVVSATLRTDRARWRKALDPAAGTREGIGAWWRALSRPWILAPAAAMVILIAVTVARRSADLGDVRQLATFSLPRETSIARGSGDVAPGDAVAELIETGLAHLELGQSEEAERRFRAALDRDPNAVEATYLLGLSLAKRGRIDEARPLLTDAAHRATGALAAEASWTLANADLAAGRARDARAVLESLATTAGNRAADARDLLQRLPR